MKISLGNLLCNTFEFLCIMKQGMSCECCSYYLHINEKKYSVLTRCHIHILKVPFCSNRIEMLLAFASY